ncbi:FxLD family lanthipeptide [Streptosporangium sp. NPDC023615]|uniref:FxLD family lanthipeptide n=1 Tax=Streptosporangium sp. NPDC023615 TaxID=3154794 RepID=UPI003444B115
MNISTMGVATPTGVLPESDLDVRMPEQTDTGAVADLGPFDLRVETLEQADTAGLINMTEDNCGSTCGACVTGAA